MAFLNLLWRLENGSLLRALIQAPFNSPNQLLASDLVADDAAILPEAW